MIGDTHKIHENQYSPIINVIYCTLKKNYTLSLTDISILQLISCFKSWKYWYLWLVINYISVTIEKLHNCSKLHTLNLRGNALYEVSNLECCSQLWNIDLSNNEVSKTDIQCMWVGNNSGSHHISPTVLTTGTPIHLTRN